MKLLEKKASGSRINHDETEILKICSWRGDYPGLPPHLNKNRVIALDIFFGLNEEKKNCINVKIK